MRTNLQLPPVAQELAIYSPLAPLDVNGDQNAGPACAGLTGLRWNNEGALNAPSEKKNACLLQAFF